MLRRLVVGGSRSISTSWARMNPVEEDLTANPFYEKYADKIKMVPKADYIERLKQKKEARAEAAKSVPSMMSPMTGLDVKPRSPAKKSPLMKTSDLSDLVKLEMLREKNDKEIAHIWHEYHKHMDVIAAVVPSNIYRLIRERSIEYPIFLLPLPRKEGYEFILSQFSRNEVHFTQLLSWQTHKENAPECLVMVYYPELMETKGIVLMKGEYDKKVLTPLEAQCLANTLQLYYGEEDKRRSHLLQMFTHHPDKFKHMDLISEMEVLGFAK